MKPDYSAWLTRERLLAEEKVWAVHPRPLVPLVRNLIVCGEANGSTQRILEVGCGTGWNALGLYTGRYVNYTGVDANPACIARASLRAPCARFVCADVRDILGVRQYDVIMAESFLKHFEYEEWVRIFTGLQQMCSRFLFTMPTIPEGVREDGPAEWAHLRVSMGLIEYTCVEGGHEVESAWGTESEEPIYLTRRKRG